MEPKSKTKEIIQKVFSLIKKEVKPNSEYKNNVKKLFRDFLMSNTNEKRRYIIDIMKEMNFNGEDINIQPHLDIFYLKFFNMAQSIFEDKDNSKEVEITIKAQELNALEEEDIKILFFYLQFSILVDKSIQVFFAFLNPKICEIFLMGKFTHLNVNALDDPEELFKSFELEQLSGELQNIKNKKEIKLIGFEPLVNKYLNIDKKSYSNKIIKNNVFQEETINKNIKKETLISPAENINIVNLNEKDDLNLDKDKFTGEEKKINIIINNNNENFSSKSEMEIMNDKNIDLLKEKNNEIKNKAKNLPGTNLKEIYIKEEIHFTPKRVVLKKGSIENNHQNSHGKMISKIEIESPNEIKFKNNEKINEDNDININDKADSLNYTNINQLKINLYQQKVCDYIHSQKMKYFGIFNNDYPMIQAIDTLHMHNLSFNFKSNELKYWNLNKALKEIKDLFSNNSNIMKPEYGYFISNKKFLFYATVDSEEEDEILFNSKYLKQLNYDYAAEKESSYKTYTVNIEQDNERIEKIDYFLIKGMDFEKNWTFFFDSYFDLKKLPNIFFPISTLLDRKYYKKNNFKNKSEVNSKSFDNSYKKEDKGKMTFKIYADSMFYSFIETDFARINMNNIDIQPEFIFKPFINEPPIHVVRDKNGEFICKINENNEFKIHANTIILGEAKHSVPEKVLNIEQEEAIDVKNIQRTLFFVLYKLIKKIDYYLDFVKYEILDDSENIKNYKLQLFLIYNNKPISEMNTFIKTCFDNFIKYKYIKNEFIFQIIYSAPSISSFSINKLSKEIKDVKLKLANMEKKIEALEKKANSVKAENSKNN